MGPLGPDIAVRSLPRLLQRVKIPSEKHIPVTLSTVFVNFWRRSGKFY